MNQAVTVRQNDMDFIFFEVATRTKVSSLRTMQSLYPLVYTPLYCTGRMFLGMHP